MDDFTNKTYAPLRKAIAYLLKQDKDVRYRDDQLTAALDKLCCYDESDDTMINVDVKMIMQAVTKPRRIGDIVGYGVVLNNNTEESEHFLHITHLPDDRKALACSDSSGGKDFSDAQVELSTDTDAVYAEAAAGGWPDMQQHLIQFLRKMKTERSKQKKKKKRGRNNNATQRNQPSSNSARQSTPSNGVNPGAATSGTPSTKSPAPKRGKTSSARPPLISSSVSTDEDELDAAQLRELLYDGNGRLRPEVVDILRDDTNYALIERQTSRNDRVAAAAKVIAPHFKGAAGQFTNDTNSSPTHSNTTTSDANQLQVILAAITNGNSERAAAAITRMLGRDDCRYVEDAVKKAFDNEEAKLSDIIIDGINEAISHHTNPKGGTRTLVAEAFIKDVVLACVWGTVDEEGEQISNSRLSEIIGTTNNQVSTARTTARNIRSGESEITALERNRRKDFVRDALLPYLKEWVEDDTVTRFDSNQTHVTIVDPFDESKTVTKHKRIWLLLGSVHRFVEFTTNSTYYKAFQEANPGATVGQTVFSEELKKFCGYVSDPKPESCVDERVSGLEHLMEALFGVLNKSDAKQVLQGYEPNEGETSLEALREVLQRRSSHKFVDLVCCKKEKQHDLHIDPSKDCPEMIPFRCTHGKNVSVAVKIGKKKYKDKAEYTVPCACCGINMRLGRIFALLKDDGNLANKEVVAMVWGESRRQGKTEDGKENSQRELQSKIMTVAELIDLLVELLQICIPHIQEIRWIKFLQDTDFTKMDPGTIIILTDYAAMMALRAREAKNSSVDAHAVLCNQVILWNKRPVPVTGKEKGEDGEEVDTKEEVTICNCDYIHFFAETFEPNKKNDHSMHNTCLDDTIVTYRAKLRAMGIELTRVIIWTDKAPHQYRCRQTFLQVASIELRHPGIEVFHRLAVVDNFKGIHDAVGKDPSRKVKELEKVGIRSPTAEKVFENCILHLEKTETIWDKLEAAGDIKLKGKRKFSENSRSMKFVVENEDEYNRLAPQFPGRILLCDRSNVQDTIGKTPIEGTQQLHEVRSIEPTIPLSTARKRGNRKGEQTRHWRVLVSNLPCNCVHCNNLERVIQGNRSAGLDANTIANTSCKYSNWRKTRIVTMRNFVSCEPSSAITQSAAEYQASQPVEVPMETDATDESAEIKATVERMVEAVVKQNEIRSSNGSSIELFRILAYEDRARVTRLLRWETTTDCDLSYAFDAAWRVQHASLKRLHWGRWLNDEVINGFIVHYLRLRHDEYSHIFSTHFMSKLLNTGEHGTDTPNYTYSNVSRWSSRIGRSLFELHNIFVPINHQKIHWLLLYVSMPDKKILLRDSQGRKNANVIYTNSMLKYLGDEYRKAFPSEDTTAWLKEWTVEDLSDESPRQENGHDCGIFLLLNLCCLIMDGALSLDSYSQTTVNTKEVRKTIAHLLWKASSNRPVV